MKNNKRICLMILTVLLILGLSSAAFAAGLSDLNGHWAQKQVEDWVELGLASGYPDGTFKPDNSITRAEFVVLVNKAFDFNNDAECDFADVQSTDWYCKDVAAAKAAGYISGYEDKTFKPNREISRQEVAVIVAKLLGLDTSEEPDGLDKFVDADLIPGWAKGSVNAVVNAGIIKGYPDKSFRNIKSITRAEAIVVLNAALGKNSEQGIEGTVTYNGEAAEDAVIRVFEKDGYEVIEEIEADNDGTFKLKLSQGEYDITAVTDEAVAYDSDVEVTALGGFVSLELELEDAVIISGKLNDKNSKAVKNTEIMFTTNPTFITTTDTNGNYKLAVLPDKEYTVRAVNPQNGKIEVVEESVDVGSAEKQSMDTLKASFAVSSSSGGGGGGGGGGGSSNTSSLDYEQDSEDPTTYNLSGINDNPIGTKTIPIDSSVKVADVESINDFKLYVDQKEIVDEYIKVLVLQKITIENNKVKLNNINSSYDTLKVIIDDFAPDGKANQLLISVKDADDSNEWVDFTFNLK